MDDRPQTEGVRRYLPILTWLPDYRAEWLRFDVLAALSVRILLAVVGSDQRELMTTTGTLASIGSANIYRTVRAAVVEARRGSG